jgi:hypothetical protein
VTKPDCQKHFAIKRVPATVMWIATAGLRIGRSRSDALDVGMEVRISPRERAITLM